MDMKKHNAILIICALTFAAGLMQVTGCGKTSSGKGYYALVRYVVDGDTVKLANGETVRYIGIDTPEINYYEGAAEHLAWEAKAFNEQLVSHRVVRLEFDVEKRDKYDRLLAYVFTKGTFVNAELLKEGYADVLNIPPNVRYAEFFARTQQEAQRNNKGIWQEQSNARPF